MIEIQVHPSADDINNRVDEAYHEPSAPPTRHRRITATAELI